MADHPIVHVDIPAEDPQALSQFYADLFGWQIQPIPQMQYTRFQAPNGITGGFMAPGGDAANRVGEMLVYVHSADIAADLARAEALGGRVLIPETPIPRTGAFAVLADPAGNRLGLFHRTGFVPGSSGS